MPNSGAKRLICELKKIGKVFKSKFVWERALVLYKRKLPGRGLTKVEKHCSRAEKLQQSLNRCSVRKIYFLFRPEEKGKGSELLI